jgi:2-polyprenyl-3-methyl-5-hydroxy-6-metoxy-1,4-benzoquinol methylase
MTQGDNRRARVLVAIASYGAANDAYLVHLVSAYQSMSNPVDIVVLSNIPKELGRGVEVIVGIPTKDPWSLPFAHKRVFVERLNQYDLFIYSEDDTLVTQRNIDAFLDVSKELAEDELAGFLRFERKKDGTMHFPDVHLCYHWDHRSVRRRGGYTFGFFTNEHAAVYMLTRVQLRRAIASGGFLVGAHHGKYGLPESAATDPYTQCGFTKLICISHLSDSLVHHLPNKYVGKLGVDAPHFECQIQALLRVAAEGNAPNALLDRHPGFTASRFGKDYYEPVRADLVDLIPNEARSVLSVGCGWGATEERLRQSGKRVIAIALDPVIAACARLRGVETLDGDLDTVLTQLSGERFESLLISNVLHLVQDPVKMLASFVPLLSKQATVIASVPNLTRLPVQWRKLRGAEAYEALGNYVKSGVHLTSHKTLRGWLKCAGLRTDRFVDILPRRAAAVCRGALGVMAPYLSSEIVTVSTRER